MAEGLNGGSIPVDGSDEEAAYNRVESSTSLDFHSVSILI